jgi:hypothetical protein
VKRKNKNAISPTTTKPTNSLVVELQRGEVVNWGSIQKSPGNYILPLVSGIIRF